MKLKYILPIGMLALLFAACGSDDDNQPDENSRVINFVSEVKPYTTRTNQDGDKWLAGDKFGAYMVETGTFTPVANSENVLYTAEAEGASVKFTSTTPLLMPADGSKVDFVGYYPYSAEVKDFIYPVSLANQAAGSAAHDLMRSTSRQGYSLISTRDVSVSFSHQLSKVTFRFQDAEKKPITPEQLILKGMNTTARFNLTTGVLDNISTIADITPYKTATGTFDAVVIPANIADSYSIDYVIDGQTFSWNLTESDPVFTQLETGYTYTYTLTHSESEPPTGEVEIGNENSVTPWGDGGGGDAEAELQVNYTVFPLNEATNVHKDTYLKLNFTGAAPVIGTTGSIRVYKAEDHTLVDEINMADVQSTLSSNGGTLNSKMDIIGGFGGRYRVVNYNPVTIEGTTAVIKLHTNKLAFNTKYYVLIGAKAIKHTDFFGINEASKWTFTTKPAPTLDASNTVTVGGDHSTADFRTIQTAMEYLAEKAGKDASKTINIENGIYEELLFLRNINNITLKGQSKEGVIIRYNNYDGFNGGVGASIDFDPKAKTGATISKGGGRCLFLIEGVDKIRFESLTIENTHVKAGNGDQAEAIYANNDNKGLIFINCNLLSCQDTLNLKGFCWFYNCLVAGDVDFIWGSPAAALFEACEIRAVNDGYVLQARVAQNNKGFVFLNCELTATDKAQKVFLARTAGNTSFDNIAFINCKMADTYATYGWGLTGGSTGTPPNPATATLENGYKTYKCTGLTGGNITINNSQYAYTLTDDEYTAHYSNRSVILSGYSNVGWFAE